MCDNSKSAERIDLIFGLKFFGFIGAFQMSKSVVGWKLQDIQMPVTVVLPGFCSLFGAKTTKVSISLLVSLKGGV
jgi:hypothetical protein